MTTFSAWRTKFKETKMPRHVVWLCGNERILVDEVVSEMKIALNPDPWNYVVLSAGSDTDRQIWNDIRQLPLGLKGNRVTIVLHADKLVNDQMFMDWVRDRNLYPRNWTIFVSDEAELTKVPTERGRGEMAPKLAYCRAGKADLIECRSFTVTTAKYAVEWVQEKAKIRKQVAAHLLNRADGNLRLVRDVVAKMKVFPGEITMSVVNDMLAEEPQDTFVDALFSLDKKTALTALKRLPTESYGRTLGLIDSRLELAGLAHDMQVEHKTGGEIARAAGNKNFLIKDILPVAKHYDQKRRFAIRGILSMLDEYAPIYQKGSMEVLVAFW